MQNDSFKQLDKVLESEVKRNYSFEEFYNIVAEISLVDTVPQNIHLHFNTAKNLMLYSWFVNRFHHVSELHAFSTIELAIRTKIEIVTNDKCRIRNLRPLLEHAIKQRWIIDDGFPKMVEKNKLVKENQEMLESVGINSTKEEINDIQKYSKALIYYFPTLRNLFAHGSNSIFPSYLDLLDTCRYLINQLFNE